MDYFLKPIFLDPSISIQITKDDYYALARASEILHAAFQIEENYDLLIGNYLELETASLAIVTHSMARNRLGYKDMFEVRSEINRRAVNFLSTARLFVDHLPQRVGGSGADSNSARAALSTEYDDSFSYRFMEELRNYAQHSGLVVHMLGVTSHREVLDDERHRQEAELEVCAEKRILEQDGKFKNRVLKESPDKVNLLRATRRYLEGLGRVQDAMRELTAEHIDGARKLFDETMTAYAQASSNGSSKGLAAHDGTVGATIPPVPIFTDWDDVRIRLSKRNRNLMHLSQSVITSSSSKWKECAN